MSYWGGIGNGLLWEYWGTLTPVYIDGITSLLNITYVSVDTKKTYAQILNLPVQSSGSAPPSLAAPPAPQVTPKGFGQDVTNFLSTSQGSMIGLAFARLFQNIGPNIAGAAPGAVVAAQSGPDYPQLLPNYEFSWVRDSALVMSVVQNLYSASTKQGTKKKYEQVLFNYATSRATQQDYPGLQTGLGEPKFYLNQTLFTGPWARPQNDGPALAAITLIEFATQFLAAGGNVSVVQQYIYDSTTFPSTASVQRDLLYTAANWASTSYDLWEEVTSSQFFTRMVQRRALVLGSALATRMGDSATALTLASAVTAINPSFAQFWSASRSSLLYEYGQVLGGKTSYLDTSVILAILHGYADDGFYGPTNEQVLSSALRIATSFISVYPVNNITTDSAGRPLGIAIGRYPEDAYNGTGTQAGGGNPWYLTTAALAEFMYRVSKEYSSAEQIVVSSVSKPFFDFFAPSAKLVTGQTYIQSTKQFRQAINGINGWGDAFVRTIKQYMPASGALSEQFNKKTGQPQGAADLSWSYAALLTAAFARADVQGQTLYVTNLANQGFVSNYDE